MRPKHSRRFSFRNQVRLAVLGTLALAAFVSWWSMIRMPGKSFRGELPPLVLEETALREELAASVEKLAGEIGVRNVYRYAELTAAAEYIEQSFAASGYAPRRDEYQVEGKTCWNIEVEIPGGALPAEILIIGAHYDTVPGSPGANDNASGVAATLALARRFAGKQLARTIRFVAFVNEEPGHFQSEKMGSLVYAGRCKERGERIVGMISLETIGYFSDAPGSQEYPVPLLGFIYPSSGNFIAFVGNVASAGLVRKTIGSFRRHAQFPSEGAALPAGLPGIGWSDHWSFWQHGYPALMITDTAPFRYAHYHGGGDTPDQLNYDAMARIVHGMAAVIEDLAAKR